MHFLKHLLDDVHANVDLNPFSSFPFESYMRKIRKSVHSSYAVAKQTAQRYAEISFCGRLQASISATNLQTVVKSDPGNQIVICKKNKTTSFKSHNVIIVHGKPVLVTDIRKNGLIRFRLFNDPCDYFEEPFPSNNIEISMCSIVSHEHT